MERDGSSIPVLSSKAGGADGGDGDQQAASKKKAQNIKISSTSEAAAAAKGTAVACNASLEQRRMAAIRQIQAKRDFLNRVTLNQSLGQKALTELHKRTAFDLHEAIRPRRKGHLFEHFIVVGWPPTLRVNPKIPPQQQLTTPVILYQYPEDKSGLEDAVVHFCFPNKIQPWIQPRTSKSSEKLEEKILFPIDDLSNSEHSYIFLMTGDGSLLYGVCVSQEELLSPIDKPSFMRSPAYSPPDGLLKDDLEYDIAAPRVYCFITRFPFFQLHFNTIYHLLELERKNNISATVRRDQFIARKKKERATIKSDSDINSKWFGGLGNWFSKKNKGGANAGQQVASPKRSLIPTLRISASPAERRAEPDLRTRAMRASSVESAEAMKERMNQDLLSGTAGSLSPIPEERTRSASLQEENTQELKNQDSDDDMVKRLQMHHASIIKAQAKKEQERELKMKEREQEYEQKISRIIESIHHAASPPPEHQNLTTTVRQGHRRNRSDVSLIVRSTLQQQQLEVTESSSNSQESKKTTQKAPSSQLGVSHSIAPSTPPPTRKTTSLGLSPEEKRERRSSALISGKRILSDFNEPDEDGPNDSDSFGTSEEEDEARAARMRNKVLSVLNEYYATEPKRVERFTSKLPRGRKKGSFISPKGEEEKAMAEWCLPSLLRLVSLDKFILLLRGIVLEFKIVVVSPNLGILANVVLSVIALLRPLVWQGPFIPILPGDMAECIESPVPFIIGTQRLDPDREAYVRSDCIVLDVDNNEISLPACHLPALPRERELVDKLQPIYDKIFTSPQDKDKERKEHLLMPSKTTKKEIKATQEIVQIVQRYHEELISEVVNYAHIYAIATSTPASILPDIPRSRPLSVFAAGNQAGASSTNLPSTPNKVRKPLSANASPMGKIPLSRSPEGGNRYPAWSGSQPMGTHACRSWNRPLNDEILSSLSNRTALSPTISASLDVLPPFLASGASRTESLSMGMRGLLASMPHRMSASPPSHLVASVMPSSASSSFSTVVSAGGRRPIPLRQQHHHPDNTLYSSQQLSTKRGHLHRFNPLQHHHQQQPHQQQSRKGPRLLSLSTSALPSLHSIFSSSDSEHESNERVELRPRSLSHSALLSMTEEQKEELASTPLLLHAAGSKQNTPTRASGAPMVRYHRRARSMWAGSDSEDYFDDEEEENEEEEEERRLRPPQPTLKLSLTPMNSLFSSSLPQLSTSTFLFSSHDHLEQLTSMFPLNYHNFMRAFLFTQLWTVYTEELDRIFAERRSQISLDQLMRKDKGKEKDAEDEEGSRAINYVTPRNAAKFSEQIRNLIAYEEGQLQSAESLLQIFAQLPASEKNREEEAALDDIILHSSRRLALLITARDAIAALLRTPSSPNSPSTESKQ